MRDREYTNHAGTAGNENTDKSPKVVHSPDIMLANGRRASSRGSKIPKQPKHVGISIDITNITNLDSIKGTFDATFVMSVEWPATQKEIEKYNKKPSDWEPTWVFYFVLYSKLCIFACEYMCIQ